MVGDGCNLPELGEFGCVLAVNLLCRLPDPTLFITHLCTLIVSGGIVVMVSPYAWMEQYTPKVCVKNHEGYYYRDGKRLTNKQFRIPSIVVPHCRVTSFTSSRDEVCKRLLSCIPLKTHVSSMFCNRVDVRLLCGQSRCGSLSKMLLFILALTRL